MTEDDTTTSTTQILTVLGVVAIVVVWFAIIPMIGDMIGGEPGRATGTLSFSGGIISDGDTVTIGSTTFEFDVAGNGVSGGNVDVDVPDGTAATASTNLETAINNDATVSALVTAVRFP